jgi:hypothetical protein
MTGPDRSRRWRLAAISLAAVLGVLSAAPTALASGPASEPFGLTPWPSAEGTVRPYFTLNVAAGESATASALVSNEGRTGERLLIGRSTGLTAANGGSSFGQAFKRCTGAGCWVTGLPATVTLPPGTGERLRFTVSVPRGTAPGQYLAGLTAQAAAKPKPVKLGSNGKATGQAIIIDQVTVGVAVTVGSLSALTTRLKIPSVSAIAIGSAVRLNIDLANTGQTFAHGTGRVSCTANRRRRSWPFYASTVLPGERAVIAANLPGLAATGMTIPCSVSIGYSSGLTARWSGPVTVPGASTSRVVHTGPGAYSTIPASGIPAWATALIVIGVLLIAAAVVLIVRVRGRGQIG